MVRSRLQFMFLIMSLVMSLVFTQLISAGAEAQIDPASGLLLGPGASQDLPSRENGLDSGRYTTRPKSTAASRRKASTNSTTVIVETKTDSRPLVQSTKPAPAPLPSVLVDVPDAPAPAPTVAPKPSPVAVAPAPVVPVAPVVAVAPTVNPVILASPQPILFVAKPDPIDRRWDLLNINIAPGYFVQDSQSRYAYRNYQFTAPAVSISADAWVFPEFGFHAKFFSSLGGSLKDSFDGSQDVWAAEQDLEIGARWRHQTGADTQSPTLFFGVDWSSNQMKVPSDSMLRQHLRTDGVTVSGGFEIPTSENYAWTGDLSIMPFADQVERSNAMYVSSGQHADTGAIGVAIGGRYAFDHADSIFWKLSGRLQKDVYQGQADPPDPLTGQTLSGVTITTRSVLFELGFSFGN